MTCLEATSIKYEGEFLKWLLLIKSCLWFRTLYLTMFFGSHYILIKYTKIVTDNNNSFKLINKAVFRQLNFNNFKVKFLKLWQVDHFLVWGFFKFITTKEPNSGNFTHIFSRNNCTEKIFAKNFCCWALFLS